MLSYGYYADDVKNYVVIESLLIKANSRQLIFDTLFNLYISTCHLLFWELLFVLFHLAIVLSVLRFTASDYLITPFVSSNCSYHMDA